MLTKAFEKIGDMRQELLTAMDMPVETEEEKAIKVETVKKIYDNLGIGEDAKQEIINLHKQAMESIAALGLEEESASFLYNYANKLIGRNK